jgi:hypothetical protein
MIHASSEVMHQVRKETSLTLLDALYAGQVELLADLLDVVDACHQVQARREVVAGLGVV